jgi:hypothetical protein
MTGDTLGPALMGMAGVVVGGVVVGVSGYVTARLTARKQAEATINQESRQCEAERIDLQREKCGELLGLLHEICEANEPQETANPSATAARRSRIEPLPPSGR